MIWWKPIPGHHGYEVSQTGIVRSWRRQGAATDLAQKPRYIQITRKQYVVLRDDARKPQPMHIRRVLQLSGWLDDPRYPG